jgi:hypothetical protein
MECLSGPLKSTAIIVASANMSMRVKRTKAAFSGSESPSVAGVRLSSVMSPLHRFKIGQVVRYRGDSFRILGRIEIAGGQPTYRIRRETDDNERVVLERELTDPRPQKRSRTRK